MPFEDEAELLQAGVRAGLLDADKGTAALVIYTQLKNQGVAFSFGDFLVDRGLITRMGLEGLEQNLNDGTGESLRTTWKLGDFELLELLGEGEHGSVFRACQASTGRPVALKILSPALAQDPEALKRFLEEAHTCARLKHDHIIQIVRVAMAEGLYYYAMELMDGGSTRKLLKDSGGRIEEGRALEIVRQVASALQAAHEAGLVHRDVKPENILLTAQGQAVLSDLGIAVQLDTSQLNPDEGRGEFWGTPYYLAPEIISGTAVKDPRSDLYSLGATLFEFLTGQPPFVADDPRDILRHHIHSEPQNVRALNPEISTQTAAMISVLLLKEPQSRFPDAATLVQAVDMVNQRRQRGLSARRASPGRAPAGSERRAGSNVSRRELARGASSERRRASQASGREKAKGSFSERRRAKKAGGREEAKPAPSERRRFSRNSAKDVPKKPEKRARFQSQRDAKGSQRARFKGGKKRGE